LIAEGLAQTVTLLLDTHAVLWWLKGHQRPPKRARKLLGDSDNERWVSYISVWEVAIKINLGKLDTDGMSVADITETLSSQEFSFLPLHLEHPSRVTEPPNLHRDPFDRMLIA
jgi:PIN domain nuclease of toxin-antitoxin system